MCQILGMNCAEKTDFCFSFKGFRLRGGESDIHTDGWGLAIYEGRGLRTFTDNLPAARSPLAEMVSNYPIKTLNMISHIRYATQGDAGDLANVHPFQREMWGIQWCFCHNGDCPKFSGIGVGQGVPTIGKATIYDQMYTPVGDTDSEAVFCAILNALKAQFDAPPSLPELYKTIQKLCCEIVQGEEQDTICNFLLGCSQYTLFAFSWPGARPGSKVWNGLYYTVRQPPFNEAELVDMDYTVDFSKVTTDSDRVAVITTKPLTTNERWVEFKRGELLMFDKGRPYSEPSECESVEREGRGLCSKYHRRRGSSVGSSNSSQSSIDSILIPGEVNGAEGAVTAERDVEFRTNQLMNQILPNH